MKYHLDSYIIVARCQYRLEDSHVHAEHDHRHPCEEETTELDDLRALPINHRFEESYTARKPSVYYHGTTSVMKRVEDAEQRM